MQSAFDIFFTNGPQNDLIAKFSVVVPTEMTVCSNDSVSDNNSNKHGVVKYFCLDCWKALCVECYRVHLETKVTEQHKVRPVASIDEADISNRRRKMLSLCSLHKDEKLVKFCYQCQDVICSSCVAENHASHHCVELKTIDKKIAQELRKEQEEILEHEVDISQQMQSIESKIKAVDNNKSETLFEIQEHATKLRSKAHEAYMKIIAKINDVEEEAKERVVEKAAKSKQCLLLSKDACETKINKLHEINSAFDIILNPSTPVVEQCQFSILWLDSEILPTICSEELDPAVTNEIKLTSLVYVPVRINFGESSSEELRVEATMSVPQLPLRSHENEIDKEISVSLLNDDDSNDTPLLPPQHTDGNTNSHEMHDNDAVFLADSALEDEGEGLPPVTRNPELRTVIRCTYAEGQWSPSNQSGEKRYNVEFLLQFKDVYYQRPSKLKHMPGCTAPPDDSPFYRTMMCHYLSTCIFGDEFCIYAHKLEDLRPKPKWLMCRNIERTGYCIHGDTCVFAHTTEEMNEAIEAHYEMQQPVNITNEMVDDTVCLRPGGVGNVPKWMEGAKGSRVMAVGKKPATVAAPFSAPASATAWGASKYRPPEKLEFTDAQTALTLPPGRLVNINELRQVISTAKENDSIFEWIESHLSVEERSQPPFVRDLTLALCSAAITGNDNSSVNVDIVKQHSVILRKFLEHKTELQLQALYALQALVHAFNHPQGMLLAFFDTLYHEDVITDDAFIQWEQSNDPQEQNGRGAAKMSVVQFFAWLKEADDKADN